MRRKRKYKKEISAGGIVYRKNRKGQIEILLLKDAKNSWTFPKGLIEKNEDKVRTAEREIREEVGVMEIKYEADLDRVFYKYIFEDILVDKTVYYYLFKLVGKPSIKVQKEEGIKEAKFVNLDQSFKIIGYEKTNLPVLKKVKEYFQKN